MGADPEDLVPFEKYAKATSGLSQPSSAAKALDRGAIAIERVDKLVKLLADQQGMTNTAINQIVDNVEWYLDNNSKQRVVA